MFIKLNITFSPKKELVAKNFFINSVFYKIIGEVNMDLTKFLKKYGKTYFSLRFVFGSILDHISAVHAKIRVKSLL